MTVIGMCSHHCCSRWCFQRTDCMGFVFHRDEESCNLISSTNPYAIKPGISDSLNKLVYIRDINTQLAQGKSEIFCGI